MPHAIALFEPTPYLDDYDQPLEERKPPRSDSLPEGIAYHDEGCDIHPACLTCPLPVCRYDAGPGGLRTVRIAEKREQALRLKASGLRIDGIAVRMGVSMRTVFRWLAL